MERGSKWQPSLPVHLARHFPLCKSVVLIPGAGYVTPPTTCSQAVGGVTVLTSVNSDQAQFVEYLRRSFGFCWIARLGSDQSAAQNKTLLSFLSGSMHQLHKSERRVGRSQRSDPPTSSLAVAAAGLQSRQPLPLLFADANQPSRQISPVEPATAWTSACSHAPGTALSSTITPPTKPLPLSQAPTHPTPPQHGRFSATRCSVQAFFHFESRGPRCQNRNT